MIRRGRAIHWAVGKAGGPGSGRRDLSFVRAGTVWSASWHEGRIALGVREDLKCGLENSPRGCSK